MIYNDELTLNDRTQMLLDEVLDREPLLVESAEDIKTAIDKAIEAEDTPLFIEGAVARLTQLGYQYTSDDTKTIRKELDRRYKEILGKECPRAVHNWLNGGIPGTDGRINNYDVCYALEMDVRQTGTFMQKYFLTQPFNCKSRIDAIYLYCLYHKKPYSLVKELLEVSEGFVTQEKAYTSTSQIEARIIAEDNDEAFKNYLSEHCYGKDQQFMLARSMINSDVNTIKDRLLPDRKGDERLNNKIIEKIFNINYQSGTRSRGKVKKLPKRFTESLPNDVTLGKILNGDEATYETMRKALILFRFYSFYSNEALDNYDPIEANGNLLDFLSEINDELMKCGFAQIYMRHPFDCLIMYCANSNDPVQAFWSVCEYGWN